MTKIPKIGDWIFIISTRVIGTAKFKEIYGDRGIFGRVIAISPYRYSPTTGEEISPEITIRAYTSQGRGHYKTRKERLKFYQEKI